MNIFEKLRQDGVSLPDLFAQFVTALSNLDDDRSQEADNSEDYDSPEHEMAESPMMEMSEDMAEMECCDEEENIDFPGGPILDFDSIDPEDISWASGREIGIPRSVAVRGYHNGSVLLPIENGMFVDSRGY